jgi:hypothetical protein
MSSGSVVETHGIRRPRSGPGKRTTSCVVHEGGTHTPLLVHPGSDDGCSQFRMGFVALQGVVMPAVIASASGGLDALGARKTHQETVVARTMRA